MDELVAWLRGEIEARLKLARYTISIGNSPEWQELASGVLVTGPDGDGGVWDGTWAMGDSSLTRLMAANDPRDTIARCEAELAILNVHRLVIADRGGGVLTRYVIINENPDMRAIERARSWHNIDCRTCHLRYPCRTIRLLGAGYRYRDGYQDEWAPGT